MKEAIAKIESNIQVDPEKGCWIWMLDSEISPKGYARSNFFGRQQAVHRVSYLVYVGPIPDGLEIDHLCRVRRCCNPEHLEAVTHAENLRRQWSEKARRERAAERTAACDPEDVLAQLERDPRFAEEVAKTRLRIAKIQM